MNLHHAKIAAAPTDFCAAELPDCLQPQALALTPVLDRFAETARICREIDRAEADFQATLPLWSISVTLDGIEEKGAGRSLLGSELAEIEVAKLADAETNGGEEFTEIVIRVRRI